MSEGITCWDVVRDDSYLEEIETKLRVPHGACVFLIVPVYQGRKAYKNARVDDIGCKFAEHSRICHRAGFTSTLPWCHAEVSEATVMYSATLKCSDGMI